ncbi:MAG: hypothetical protein V5A55_05825 [Halovenus sp.]
MVDYTRPVTTAFELQRRTIKQSQEALSQSIEFQKRFNEAVVDGMAGQESAQRRAVELQREAIHDALDALETNVPGAEDATAEVRDTVDEQFEQLLANHEEAFEDVTAELREGTETYDEFAVEYLDALDEQLALVVDAHEELEAQSTEVAEQLDQQFEELREQVQDMQDGTLDS